MTKLLAVLAIACSIIYSGVLIDFPDPRNIGYGGAGGSADAPFEEMFSKPSR